MMLTRIKRQPPLSLPGKIKAAMFKNVGTTFFIFSMLIILVLGSTTLVMLYFFLNPKQNPITIQNYQPVTSLPVTMTLNLSSPDDNNLVFDNNLLVSGTTIPGALVLITLGDDNQLINASSQGNFSLTVNLQPAYNQLIVSSFDDLGNYKSETRAIYYSKEKL